MISDVVTEILVRRRPHPESFGRDAFLEIPETLSQRVAQRRELVRSEHEQDHHEDDEHSPVPSRTVANVCRGATGF